MTHKPSVLSTSGYETFMSITDCDGRGVDAEASPDDYAKILGHPIGPVQKKIFDKIHSNPDALLYNEVERLAVQLHAGNSWVGRVVQIAKRINKGSPLLKALVAAYVEGSYASSAIIAAGHAIDAEGKLEGVDEYTLFRIANHNTSLLPFFHRPAADEVYPLSKFPSVDVRLRSFGNGIYNRVNMLYHSYAEQEAKKMVGSAPRTIALKALKLALKDTGIRIPIKEVL
ncbi:MAG: hypothetical protein QXV84_01575 [Conexivisphaerales archaeon]